MAHHPAGEDAARAETIAWLEREGVVTRSAQRLYFEQTEAGLSPDQALTAAIEFAQADW